jgi:signal peptidase I
MLRLFRIRGHSLAPEYQPGDFVVVSKIPFYFHPPGIGDVIAFKHPTYGLMIKAVSHYDPLSRLVAVCGTHPNSIDSQEFGPIPYQRVIGKILWHIHPGQ